MTTVIENNKPKKRVVISYHNLPEHLQDEMKRQHPTGFTESMIRIDKGPGDFFYAVVFETDEVNYLVKVDVKIDGNPAEEEEESEKDYYEEDIKGDDIAGDDSDDEE